MSCISCTSSPWSPGCSSRLSCRLTAGAGAGLAANAFRSSCSACAAVIRGDLTLSQPSLVLDDCTAAVISAPHAASAPYLGSFSPVLSSIRCQNSTSGPLSPSLGSIMPPKIVGEFPLEPEADFPVKISATPFRRPQFSTSARKNEMWMCHKCDLSALVEYGAPVRDFLPRP